MNVYVPSLDNPKKELDIGYAERSAIGDLVIHTDKNDFFSSVGIVGPGGIGPKPTIHPLYTATVTVNNLFAHNKQDVLFVKNVSIDPKNFQFSEENIITFAQPDFISMMCKPKLDFILSDTGFFGMRARNSSSVKKGRMNPNNPVWLCGPDNEEFADAFGRRAYKKRRKIFGELYEMALTDKMINPLFAMPDGSDYITKGKNYALHQ